MDTEDHKSSFSDWIKSPQTMIALSAVLLSVCGLFISIYETSLIREQQLASVWPNVEIAPSFGGDDVKIFVQNTGIGPARIKAAMVSYDGQIKKDWAHAVLSSTGKQQINIYQSLINGRVFPPNSSQEMVFSVSAGPDNSQQELVESLENEIENGNFDVQLCYCSVYDECWTASMQDVVKRFNGIEAPSREERKVESCRNFEKSGI